MVIPKEGKHPQLCQRYRPIWLLNVDLKIFTKILVQRLIPFVALVVPRYQTEFVSEMEAQIAKSESHFAQYNMTP